MNNTLIEFNKDMEFICNSLNSWLSVLQKDDSVSYPDYVKYFLSISDFMLKISALCDFPLPKKP